MVMTAKYNGKCSLCHEPIVAGESQIKLYQGKGWGHEVCNLDGSTPSSNSTGSASDSISGYSGVDLDSGNSGSNLEYSDEVIAEGQLNSLSDPDSDEAVAELPKAFDSNKLELIPLSDFDEKMGEVRRLIDATKKEHEEALEEKKKLEAQLKEIMDEYYAVTDAERERMDKLVQLVQKLADEKIKAAFETMQADKAPINDALKQVDTTSLYHKLNQLESVFALLQKQRLAAAKAAASQQAFDDVKEEIEEIFSEAEWYQKILPYQLDDVCTIVLAWKQGLSGVLNANPMGLGKTAESAFVLDILDHFYYKKHDRKPLALWLTKKSLIKGTKAELERWTTQRPVIYLDASFPAPQRELMVGMAIQSGALIVTNYEGLNTTDALKQVDWDLLFVDEVHKLKGGANNPPTQVWQNVRGLLGIVETGYRQFERTREVFFLPLSGSPVQNKAEEVWAYLHLFDPQTFPSVSQFQRNFISWYDGKVRTDDLLKELAGQVIRNDPEEVGLQLPDKIREFRYVEHTPKQAKIYQQAKNMILAGLPDDGTVDINSVLAQLTRLRQINVWPPSINLSTVAGQTMHVDVHESAKIDEAMELAQEIINEGEQVVVWSSQFNEPLFEMERRLKEEGIRCGVIHGGTVDQSHAMEELFQQGELDVLLCNSKSASEGFNFQKSKDRWPGGAKHAIFLDLWWNPKHNEQCEDRTWRIGVKEPVTIHIILAENSIDALISEILEEKEAMIDGIMEDKRLRPRTKKEIADLL